MINKSFWKNKRVFLTGHTGFKGSWLSLWLQELGACVRGYALTPPTSPSLFEIADVSSGMDSVIGDIRNQELLFKSISDFEPEIVIHMAAQPLVRLSYDLPVDTYDTNVMGTVKLLDCIRRIDGIKAVVNVTSDKCYDNKEWPWGYREYEPKGGHDPYSNSKGCAELVADAFRSSYFSCPSQKVALASVRAGNVIGGGDWALDRLIPDLLNAFENNQVAAIRNPNSIRPWQHVLEPLSGYLVVAQHLYEHGQEYAEAWNFGPEENDAKPVDWIVNIISKEWGNEATWELDGREQPHEANYLKLDCSKAKQRLNWQPNWCLEKTLEKIVDWHKAFLNGKDMKRLTVGEINDYMQNVK